MADVNLTTDAVIEAHRQKVEEALGAIRAVHGDTSVTQAQTLDSLEELKIECDELIGIVKEDIRGGRGPDNG